MAGRFVISLDFEMFWGVAQSRTLMEYRRNVEGEWMAIPAILDLFERYRIKATWATVGMLMCRNYEHWREMHAALRPSYQRQGCSTYCLDKVVRDYPHLFFGRSLVERIVSVPGQELGCHSFSHFYCAEPGVTLEQFAADLVSAKAVGKDLGLKYCSFVFPRNQVVPDYLPELVKAGFVVYRGNSAHRLYDVGNVAEAGIFRRSLRLVDSYLPLSGPRVERLHTSNGLVNCPSSFFLRPWSASQAPLEPLRLWRLKHTMVAAAQSGGVFHLWWHPHNFGVRMHENLAVLEEVLKFYRELADRYGMISSCMGDFSDALVS